MVGGAACEGSEPHVHGVPGVIAAVNQLVGRAAVACDLREAVDALGDRENLPGVKHNALPDLVVQLDGI